MDPREGLVVKGLAVVAGVMMILSVLGLGLLPRAASPQGTALEVFAAPSHVPAGESWIFLGSTQEIPADAVVSALPAGVSVLEVLRLSARALSARIDVAVGASGKLLKVGSASASSEAFPDLYLGQDVPPLTADANIAAEDLAAGLLTVSGEDFMYGYFPQAEVALAAVRIHNRSTGAWHRHEIAQTAAEEAARKAAEEDLTPAPAFNEDMLPDTDGDGIPDFAEDPEVKEPRPDFLGVALVPGENMLDLVTVDDAGNTSWRTINVVSTHVPPVGDQ